MLDGGRLVERGTHEELVELGGRYAALLQGAVVDGPDQAVASILSRT